VDDPKFSAFELKAGSLYRVKVSFIDHEQRVHPVGESWRYESRNFIPYHAGLALNVVDTSGPRNILFQDYPEAQGEIVSNFSDYVVEVVPPPLAAVHPNIA
jgi:hypothetical protein